MEKLTYEQIIEKLKVITDDSVSNFAYGECFDYLTDEKGKLIYGKHKIHDELGPVTEVEQVGGEDEGTTWYAVWYFENHDVYIRVDGYYSSYEGTDFYDGWDCCSNVRPKEKTITVYE